MSRYLDQLAKWLGYLKQICVDNGSKFTPSIFTDWASAHGVYIDYIKPGYPHQKACIKWFNRSDRNEVLSCDLFNDLHKIS